MTENTYAPKEDIDPDWNSTTINNSLKEYSRFKKIKFSKKNYRDKASQLVREEFKLKREGYYLSLGFIDQKCTLCNKCIRPLLCNNALSRPDWTKFPMLQKKYNLHSGEGIILIAPEKEPGRIPVKRYDFLETLEKKFDARLYCINSREIEISWKAITQCMYGCRNFCRFSRRHCCPPFCLTPDETKKIRERYENALIICKTMQTPLINSSWLGFNPIRDINQKIWCHYHFGAINKTGNSIEAFMRKRYDVYAFSATCNRCITCSYPNECKKPDLMRFVPEGCGIDMYDLAKKIGIPVEIPPLDRINLIDITFFKAQ